MASAEQQEHEPGVDPETHQPRVPRPRVEVGRRDDHGRDEVEGERGDERQEQLVEPVEGSVLRPNRAHRGDEDRESEYLLERAEGADERGWDAVVVQEAEEGDLERQEPDERHEAGARNACEHRDHRQPKDRSDDTGEPQGRRRPDEDEDRHGRQPDPPGIAAAAPSRRQRDSRSGHGPPG
jgi:hypothetical protein